MTNPTPQGPLEIDAIRQALEALADDELESSLLINRSLTPGPDQPPEILREHALRQELAREVLESRRPAPVERQWPNVPTAAERVGKPTQALHVDVPQADGSVMRFHCRVLADPVINWRQEAIDCATTSRPKYRAPGRLERAWRRLPWSYRPLTKDEVWALKAD